MHCGLSSMPWVRYDPIVKCTVVGGTSIGFGADGICFFMGDPLHLGHCGIPAVSAISTSTECNRVSTTMPQILNCSEHANDDEVHYLTTLLLYHLVERCGGQLQFSIQDVQQMRESLSSKMVQIQLGNEVRLRIIDRVPELQ